MKCLKVRIGWLDYILPLGALDTIADLQQAEQKQDKYLVKPAEMSIEVIDFDRLVSEGTAEAEIVTKEDLQTRLSDSQKSASSAYTRAAAAEKELKELKDRIASNACAATLGT